MEMQLRINEMMEYLGDNIIAGRQASIDVQHQCYMLLRDIRDSYESDIVHALDLVDLIPLEEIKQCHAKTKRNGG